jgi:guanylate kinase
LNPAIAGLGSNTVFGFSLKMSKQQSSFPGYILALTGPSGVGKSTICKLLSGTLSPLASNVSIVTTRQPKQGDEKEYTYVTVDEFLHELETGSIIAHTRIPSATELRYYGYRKQDIQSLWDQGKLPIVITEMQLLQALAHHYGRRSILSLGLLPPGKSKREMLSTLLHRLRQRGRETEEQILERLTNAEDDLRFFEERKDLFDHFVINEQLSQAMDIVHLHAKERLI